MDNEPDLVLEGYDEINPIFVGQIMDAIRRAHPKVKSVLFDGPMIQYGNMEAKWFYYLFYEY